MSAKRLVFLLLAAVGMVFRTFDGKPMMMLHCPNGSGARPRIFEMEDTSDRILRRCLCLLNCRIAAIPFATAIS
jgi:hypothetical protein